MDLFAPTMPPTKQEKEKVIADTYRMIGVLELETFFTIQNKIDTFRKYAAYQREEGFRLRNSGWKETYDQSAKIYDEAAEKQEIYLAIHMKASSLDATADNLLVLGFNQNLVIKTIADDFDLNVDQKIKLLGILKQKNGKYWQKEYSQAIKGQKNWKAMNSKNKDSRKKTQLEVLLPELSLMSNKERERFASYVLGEDEKQERMSLPKWDEGTKPVQTTFSAQSLANDEWVKQYANEQVIGEAEALKLLQKHWKEISADIGYWEARRGKQFKYTDSRGKKFILNGPSNNSTKREVAAQVALCYLNQERTGIDARAIESFIAQESTWDPKVAGVNGTGALQLTGICVWDATRLEANGGRLEQVNDKLESWGFAPLSESIGKAMINGKMRSLVLVEVSTTTGKGKRAKTKKVNSYPDELGHKWKGSDSEPIVRNLPYFKQQYTNPAKAMPVATSALILYGAHPNMTLDELSEVAERYNGNNKRLSSGEKVKDVYAKKVTSYLDSQQTTLKGVQWKKKK